MLWSTIITFALAFFILKKTKIKEFVIFLAFLLILFIVSVEPLFDFYINMPFRRITNINTTQTKQITTTVASVLKLVFVVVVSLAFIYVVAKNTILYILSVIFKAFSEKNQTRQTDGLKTNKTFYFTFKKPNMKITA